MTSSFESGSLPNHIATLVSITFSSILQSKCFWCSQKKNKNKAAYCYSRALKPGNHLITSLEHAGRKYY